jgi:O-antigen ligase/tetratricopeptide (TPR) repeat protein
MKDFLQILIFGGLFLVLFLPLVVANNMFFPFITGKNFGFRIIVEIIFAAWILLALLDARYRPQFSWIMVAMTAFIAVISLAAALGAHPHTSFWSNYERMDGVVTIIHFFLYFVVLSSMRFSPKTWSIYLHTSIAVALYVSIYGMLQIFGVIPSGGKARLASTFGNEAYMAVYALFHIFFTALLFVRSKDWWWKAAYIALGALFVYTLLLTATRGTFIGLGTGGLATVLYVALFGARYPEYRKIAIGLLVGFVLVVIGFLMVKDSAFIQENPRFARLANINLQEDLKVRGVIWGMALEGVKERPILGWGHGNFNFVFNEQYDPFLYNQEQWFDRVHNIFLDWLVAAGVLGFLTYFSIMVAVLYYLAWVPLWRKEANPHFNVLERGIIIGLLVGYLTHNIVVFDNLISYIFYGFLLALIHAEYSRPIKSLETVKIDGQLVTQFVAPVMVIITGFVVYWVNVPSYQAAGDLIDGLRGQSVSARMAGFETALNRGGFGEQEITEQLAQQAMQFMRNESIPLVERQQITARAEQQLMKLAADKPGDARIHVFLSNFYRNMGNMEAAREQAALAREFSPNKPSIMIEQGAIELQADNLPEAQAFFKEAHDVASEYDLGRVLYAATLFMTDEPEAAKALVREEPFLTAYAQNDYAVNVAQQAGETEFLQSLFEIRVVLAPDNPPNWTSLAFLYYQANEIAEAIETLRRAQEAVPSYAPQAACFISNLENGRAPDVPCTE